LPALSPSELSAKILDALSESGGVGLPVPDGATNPRRFLVSHQDRSFSLWAYAWTLTPGGRPNLPYEYRIQVTTVSSPMPRNPGGPTVLLGYEPNLKTFCGFVDIRTLQRALQDGLAFDRKSNDEIAVGVRRDLLLYYCLHAPELHEAGTETETLAALEKATEFREVLDADIARLSQERRRPHSSGGRR